MRWWSPPGSDTLVVLDAPDLACRVRTSVRPGLPSLAQVTDAATRDEMLHADEHYAKKRSLRLDLWIIVMTIMAVFPNRNRSSKH